MKNTILTIAAVTAITGAANAQTFDYASVTNATNGTIGGWNVTATGFDSASTTTFFNDPLSHSPVIASTNAWFDSSPQTAGSFSIAGGPGVITDFRIHIGQSVAHTQFDKPFTIIREDENGPDTNGATGFWDPINAGDNDSNATLSFGAVTSVSWTLPTIVPQDGALYQIGITTSPVPEPSSTALLGLGALGLLARRKR